MVAWFDGEPEWVQGEEVPDCDNCAEPMQFVAQLFERGDLNFGGGGDAYVFRCACTSPASAKWLWQS